jgi:hypothetical protein
MSLFNRNFYLKFLFFLFFLYVCNSLFSQNINRQNFKLLPGSNIYIRLFLFYFPISKEYEVFINSQDKFYNLDIVINKENIKIEPDTPSFFESNLTFHIIEIPYDFTGTMKLSISIQCNQKFIRKKVNFTIYQKENILIIKGAINNLYINEITDNEYFKNRFNWKYPLYFDIRIQK